MAVAARHVVAHLRRGLANNRHVCFAVFEPIKGGRSGAHTLRAFELGVHTELQGLVVQFLANTIEQQRKTVGTGAHKRCSTLQKSTEP